MEWISVKDRLPEDFIKFNEAYLICNNDLVCRETAVFINNEWYVSSDDENIAISDVTHWMPLPEPPN